MITGRVDINRLMLEMRSMKSQTNAFEKPAGLSAQDVTGVGSGGGLTVDSTKKTGFGQIMEQAVGSVNDTQKASANMSTAYQQGVPGVDITDVMVASQKASVSFQAMVQVRNKLVEAYKDVMNMPV